jgi:plastocyanin
MKKSGIVVGVLVLAVIVGVVVVMMNTNNTSAPSNDSTTQPPTEAPNGEANNAAATITYSDTGFSPATITVKSGDTVAIKNTSSSDVHFDSDPHPVHTDNTELNVDEVAAGQTKTFTVTTKGTFGYHNHLAPSEKGEIVVE